jgi:hypothetical protein
MNAQRALLTCLTCMTAAALTGCAGKSMGPSKSAPDYYGAPETAGDYEQPAAQAYPGGAEGAPADATGASPAPMAPPRARVSMDGDAEEAPSLLPQPESRPGLATQWGESRHSRVTTAPFVRADSSSPFAVASLFYNDPQGIQSMSDTFGGGRDDVRRFPIGVGHVEIGLRDQDGRFLTGFTAGGNNYVTGMSGDRYTIFVRNHSPGRIEAVLSVDGLDVIDGKDASFGKRGYLLDPFGDLEIEGWRTSTTEVAAFRFGSVRESYANRKNGDTRNVGVIGVALFHERGDDPRFWTSRRTHEETRDRLDADPFPQRFASPPN